MASTRPALLPKPHSLEWRADAFALAAEVPIVLAAGMDESSLDSDLDSARALRDAIERVHGLRLPIETHRERTNLGPHIFLSHGREVPGRMADHYALQASAAGVELAGRGAAGLRHAVETLVQIIGQCARRGRHIRVPGCTIADGPDFELRGIMLDVSRGKVPKPETLRAIVDLCVTLKLNVLMLYTEHTFRWRRHPEVGAEDSSLDAETMRDLDRYAAARSVQLIPCLQSLGHMEHVLKLPRYRELAETEMGWTLAPVHPGSLELLRDLYDEYLPNFRSPFFNANCDEPWDLGRGQSAERSKELGEGGLYLEHVEHLREMAAAHDKRMMLWGDVVHAHPERIGELDSRLVLLDWWYEAEHDYERVAAFPAHGLEFGVCPGTSSWNSLFPRIANSIANIARWAEAGRCHGALAFINTDWGDRGHYNLQGNSFFGFAWGAQQCWSGDVDARGFDRAFSACVFGDASGEVARLYRALGAIHDPGFSIFNGSALQVLFFDDVEHSYFISAARDRKLASCGAKLERVAARLAAAEANFGARDLVWRELVYAADASLFAIEKTIAVREYNGWRRAPSSLDSRARKKLAARLGALATDQLALGRRLRRLWLARSRISNFELTQRRIKRSAQELRSASRALDRERPPPPPRTEPLTPQGTLDAIRRSL